MKDTWNPWHGCIKYSEGCRHCYVYRRDEQYEKNSAEIVKNKTFYAPIEQYKNGGYKLSPEGKVIFTCFTSDFFLEQADSWREECWKMIKRRSDVTFFIITKRILRFEQCIPSDWGSGYGNVHIGCTCENQREADRRLPVFLSAPIKKKSIICEPLLGKIDISKYLTSEIADVTVGGESGKDARICDYDWVLDIRSQCERAGVPFSFHQTGACFVKDGRLYMIPRKIQHAQAKKANIDIF